VNEHIERRTDGGEVNDAPLVARAVRGVATCQPGGLSGDQAETPELADALDEFIEECDHAWEARLVEWATDNGYPDFETVLEYAR
jgi:hypothetical protein